MSSSRSSTPLDVDGLRTTPEDTLVLRQLRRGPTLAFAEYLAFLTKLEPPPTGVLRARPGPRGPRPFTL